MWFGSPRICPGCPVGTPSNFRYIKFYITQRDLGHAYVDFRSESDI